MNVRDRYAVVEAGVVNVWLTTRLKPDGYHYAPDPSSQGACTIGGNVATNSGGPHTLKYGVTVNHVRGVELVLPDGRVVEIGGTTEDTPGLDLTGLVVGNEGAGLGRLIREKCDFFVILPMLGKVASLNAAVAGSIALYEALRQRRVEKK